MSFQELTWRERGRLWLRLGIRVVIIVLLSLTLIFLVPPLLSLLMPFVLAFIMAWLLNPTVKVLQKRIGLSRKVLSLLVLVLLFALIGGVLFVVGSTMLTELQSLLNNWQVLWQDFQFAIAELSEFATGLLSHLPEGFGDDAPDWLGQLSAWVQSTAPGLLAAAAAGAGTFAKQVPAFGVAALAFVMGSYFVTADYPHLRFLAGERVPVEFRGFWSRVKGTIASAFGGYLKAQLILSLVVFFILLIGFIIIGQGYALMLALLLAVMDFIPIIGAGTVLVPWGVVALIMGNTRYAVELFVIWGVILVFRRLAEPKIVGNETGLSPIVAVVSIYVGMRLAGVAGMILGPIFCMIAVNVVRDGLFSGMTADLRLALHDTTALLKNRPEAPLPPPEEESDEENVKE